MQCLVSLLVWPLVRGSLQLYPPTPQAIFDPRLEASIGLSAAAPRGRSAAQHFEVQHAPSVPMTREPYLGRPPLPSSRLHFQSDELVEVVLRCVPDIYENGCQFSGTSALRGVGVEVPIEGLNSGVLRFTLAPPSAARASAHYYMNTSIVGAASAGNFSKTQLLYFWVDHITRPVPGAIDVTSNGVNSSSMETQTEAIQKLIDTAVDGSTLSFPAGRYVSGALVIRRSNLNIELEPGAMLQADLSLSPSETQTEFSGFININEAQNIHIRGPKGTIDANGWNGHAVFVNRSQHVSLKYLVVRGSYSWSTHISQCHDINITGFKIFSGADGFDPDGSTDVTIDSSFVHSNDDAIAVKALTKGHSCERIVMTNMVMSSKKSSLKVGTESLSNFKDILFKDVELFFAERGLVMYPRDGGMFQNIHWENVRISSFFPYLDEGATGTVFDFEISHRKGYSQTTNITATGIEAPAITNSIFKGKPGAQLQGVHLTNLTLHVQRPKSSLTSKPYLFTCKSDVQKVSIDGLTLHWGMNRGLWSGVQEASCLDIKNCNACSQDMAPLPLLALRTEAWV